MFSNPTIQGSLMQSGATFYDKEIDYDGGTNAIYIGFAVPGSLTSETKWAIMKCEYDVSDNFLRSRFAEGSPSFNKEWDERASYDYTPIT